jgi:hypothetical protein
VPLLSSIQTLGLVISKYIIIIIIIIIIMVTSL